MRESQTKVVGLSEKDSIKTSKEISKIEGRFQPARLLAPQYFHVRGETAQKDCAACIDRHMICR
eukprot:498925-Rhodomonas_salina.2